MVVVTVLQRAQIISGCICSSGVDITLLLATWELSVHSWYIHRARMGLKPRVCHITTYQPPSKMLHDACYMYFWLCVALNYVLFTLHGAHVELFFVPHPASFPASCPSISKYNFKPLASVEPAAARCAQDLKLSSGSTEGSVTSLVHSLGCWWM